MGFEQTGTQVSIADSLPEIAPEAEPAVQANDRGTLIRSRLLSAGPLVAAVCIYIARGGRQFIKPELWAEELTILNLLATKGVRAAFAPVSGNLHPITNAPIVLGSKFLPQLPWLQVVAATIVFSFTCALFAFAPSKILDANARLWVPVGLALVPIAPELIGVGLYNFWWAALWPTAVLTWNMDDRKWFRRGAIVVFLAAMTSLAASLATLIFVPLALLHRSRRLAVVGLASAPGLVVQLLSARGGGRISSDKQSITSLVVDPLHMIGKFVWSRLQWYGPPSWPLVEPRQLTAITGLSLVALLLFCSFRMSPGKAAPMRGLAAFVVLFAGISVAARPGQTLNPLAAGPRYFFLPWAVLVVALLAVAGDIGLPPAPRVAATLALTLGALALSVGFSRPDPAKPVNWSAELRACAASQSATYTLHAQEDGQQPLWKYEFPTEWCRSNS